MSVEKLTNIANALSQRFLSKLYRQPNRVAVLLEELPTEAGFGKNVPWDAQMGGADVNTGSRAEGADFAAGDFTFDQPVPAILSWPEYAGAFSLTDLEVDAASSSQGSPEALMALLDERVMNKGQALASKLNIDAWSGTGTDGSGNPNLVGLTGGALAASGTYATLDRGTYPLWAGNVLANGGIARPLTSDLMNQALQNIYIATSTVPDSIVCDPFTYRQYKKLFNPLQRVVGISEKFDAGVPQVAFEGIPIRQDKDAPSGTMAFVNKAYVKKVYLPVSNSSHQDVWKSMMMEAVGSNGDEVLTPTGIPLVVVPLGRTGTASKFAVVTFIQVRVTRPAACALIQDIQTS